MQTRKYQHYAQNRHKVCEKQGNYYDKNVDFILEKRKISNIRKKNPVKIELNYLSN